MPPEKRKRAPTKPPKPPKQRPAPLPSLTPIAPQENDVIPQPRKRGRPKSKTAESAHIPCPFATAGRENPCPTYPKPVEKAKVITLIPR
jgi:hypothetical protein